jgi:hypothetical protein
MTFRKGLKYIISGIAATAFVFAMCLLSENLVNAADASSTVSARQAFVWNKDAYWTTLEKKYSDLRASGCKGAVEDVSGRLASLKRLAARLDSEKLPPDAPEFDELENGMFEAAPLVSACSTGIEEYLSLASEIRSVVKRQSEVWDVQSDVTRNTLYRLLYGLRGAVEEIMSQAPDGSYPVLEIGTIEPSAAPEALVRNVRLHSGDILVSRGGAPTSALIARGSDYPGNFSHIAFVYVDPVSTEAKIVEAHIEVGVVVSTAEQYLRDKKLRVMLLRPRADLPQLQKDPMLPHKAAEYAYKRATENHVPYDFAMDYRDHSRLFCSEVASEAYERFGVNLWAGISHISSPGLRRWLSEFGVEHFETQEPSDLEYDPQLRVVGEWRDPVTLKQDRIDNAVTDVMLEGAEKGEDITYPEIMYPFAGIVKGYSSVLNRFGKAGPIPEGMSVPAALRSQEYMKRHKAMAERLSKKAEQFRQEKGYEAPYWELVRMSRAVKEEQGDN